MFHGALQEGYSTTTHPQLVQFGSLLDLEEHLVAVGRDKLDVEGVF